MAAVSGSEYYIAMGTRRPLAVPMLTLYDPLVDDIRDLIARGDPKTTLHIVFISHRAHGDGRLWTRAEINRLGLLMHMHRNNLSTIVTAMNAHINDTWYLGHPRTHADIESKVIEIYTRFFGVSFEIIIGPFQ